MRSLPFHVQSNSQDVKTMGVARHQPAGGIAGLAPRGTAVPTTGRITDTDRIIDTGRTEEEQPAFIGLVPVKMVAAVVSMFTGEGVSRDLTPDHKLLAQQITTTFDPTNHVSDSSQNYAVVLCLCVGCPVCQQRLPDGRTLP